MGAFDKLTELAQLDKLKEKSNQLLNNETVGSWVNKVKQTVNEGQVSDLIGKVKTNIGLKDKTTESLEPEHTDIKTIFEKLKLLSDALNAQQQAVTELSTALKSLIKEGDFSVKIDSKTEGEQTETHQPPNDDVH